jgi:hypothetical protein
LFLSPLIDCEVLFVCFCFNLCFPLNPDSILHITGVLTFKTSLCFSPQILAIVIRSHIFHMHLVTLLLKEKIHYFSLGRISAITTMTYFLLTTSNGRMMKQLTVSFMCRGTLSIPTPSCQTSFMASYTSQSLHETFLNYFIPQFCTYVNSSFPQLTGIISTTSLTLSDVSMSYARLQILDCKPLGAEPTPYISFASF